MNSHLELEETTDVHNIIGRSPSPMQENYDVPDLFGVSDESENDEYDDENEDDDDDESDELENVQYETFRM
jgi:hypothetical protein